MEQQLLPQAGEPPKSKEKPRKASAEAQRTPTMTDVARLAGVGTMTVSRVLSGSVPVSAKTAQRVQAAVEQLKYRPNELARVFRGRRS